MMKKTLTSCKTTWTTSTCQMRVLKTMSWTLCKSSMVKAMSRSPVVSSKFKKETLIKKMGRVPGVAREGSDELLEILKANSRDTLMDRSFLV